MGTIDDYLAELSASEAAIVRGIYDIARDVVPDAEQGTGYGMPALTYKGKTLLSVKVTENHIGVYPFSPAAVASVAPLVPASDRSKGTIRFTTDNPLPTDVVRTLVSARKSEIDA